MTAPSSPSHEQAECIFCRIVAGDLPADVIRETDDVMVIRDLHPEAPVHVLALPKAHITDLSQAAASNQGILGSVMLEAANAARDLSIKNGYRVVVNVRGDDVSSEVPHLHAHLLAGRKLQWPPG